MHFSTTTTLLLSAASLSHAAFTSFALRSGSPIHFEPLSARGGYIWVGGPTDSYCPSQEVKDCPPGNVTAFAIGAPEGTAGAAAMDVEVPGGQSLFVGGVGALRYTVPHSGVVPSGGHTTGFVRQPPPSSGVVQVWSFTADGANGFFACPEAGGQYKVYANIEGADVSGCLGFDAQTQDQNSVAAWEYDA